MALPPVLFVALASVVMLHPLPVRPVGLSCFAAAAVSMQPAKTGTAGVSRLAGAAAPVVPGGTS